uniref:Uncharacterized protein n=1 Tax=Rousettus bat poxvirus TaxID=3141933 RepID=A0AAU7E1N3_9POXV
MNFILDDDAREAVQAFVASRFDARYIRATRALVLAVSGILGRLDYGFLSPAAMRYVCTAMVSRMSSVLVLNIEENYTSSSDICAAMLAMAHLPVEMAPYANLHASEIVQLVDSEVLMDMARGCRTVNTHLSVLSPFMTFYRAAAAKAARETDIVRLLLCNPAMATVLADNGTYELFSKAFEIMPDDDIAELYRYCTVPADALLEAYHTRGILPANRGLKAVTDVTVMRPIVEQFMHCPEIDFGPFVHKDVLHAREVIEVMLDNLCVHAARSTIRAALMFSMTYGQVLQRVGIKVHACIGTPDNIFQHRHPATRLTHASPGEVKFVIDNAGVYIRAMRLESDLRARVNEDESLWQYNAGVCIATYDDPTEAMWLRALQTARAFSGAKTVTDAMLELLIERGIFDYAMVCGTVRVERLVPHAMRVLRIEDALTEPYSHMLHHPEMLRVYAEKFIDNSMYLGIVMASPLSDDIKNALLNAVPPNRMPMPRLEATINTFAYAWEPRERTPAFIRSATTEHTFIDANPYAANCFVISDRLRVETGSHVRKFMRVIGHSHQPPYTGLLSVRESSHTLVRVCVGGVTVPGMQYMCATRPHPMPRVHCFNVLSDFMVLLRHNLLYRVMRFPPLNTINLATLDFASLLRTSPIGFSWHEYVTLGDELIEFASIFAFGNHYVERVRVLCCYVLQYFIHALYQWKDLFSEVNVQDVVAGAYAILTGGGESRLTPEQFAGACVEIKCAMIYHAEGSFYLNMFMEDMLSEFLVNVAPEL